MLDSNLLLVITIMIYSFMLAQIQNTGKVRAAFFATVSGSLPYVDFKFRFKLFKGSHIISYLSILSSINKRYSLRVCERLNTA